MEDFGPIMQITQKEANLSLEMGELPYWVRFNIMAKKTLVNRLKYWLFCKFFPFRVVKWDKE